VELVLIVELLVLELVGVDVVLPEPLPEFESEPEPEPELELELVLLPELPVEPLDVPAPPMLPVPPVVLFGCFPEHAPSNATLESIQSEVANRRMSFLPMISGLRSDGPFLAKDFIGSSPGASALR
jgi:hypothetical protein